MPTNYKKLLKTYFIFQPATMVFLILNILMMFVTLFMGGFNVESLLNLGALYPPFVTESGEYYRLITTAFLHGSILHALFNMIALFYLGGHLERLIGSLRYTLLYLLSAFGSSIAVVLLKPNSVTIGASGAIYGIIGALLVLTFTRKEWFYSQAIRSIRNLIIINIAFTFLVPSISIEGHLGGFIIGFIFMQFMTPYEPQIQKKLEKIEKDRQDIWIN
ncbi:MAG: rhomboid family intramembrane serine protease [Acholeplasmataceae bacterium]|nr:rhomboid family intramembrane serine protease [Acholeplasmataceae bacterium]